MDRPNGSLKFNVFYTDEVASSASIFLVCCRFTLLLFYFGFTCTVLRELCVFSKQTQFPNRWFKSRLGKVYLLLLMFGAFRLASLILSLILEFGLAQETDTWEAFSRTVLWVGYASGALAFAFTLQSWMLSCKGIHHWGVWVDGLQIFMLAGFSTFLGLAFVLWAFYLIDFQVGEWAFRTMFGIAAVCSVFEVVCFTYFGCTILSALSKGLTEESKFTSQMSNKRKTLMRKLSRFILMSVGVWFMVLCVISLLAVPTVNRNPFGFAVVIVLRDVTTSVLVVILVAFSRSNRKPDTSAPPSSVMSQSAHK